jgi:hypothetical protein
MSMAAWRMLTWELFARQRWMFGLSAAYLAVISLVCLVLPAAWRGPDLGMLLSLVLIGPAVVVLAGLAHGFEGRLEARESIFPARLFTLPVSSATLTGPPLLLGTLTTVAGWLLCALCVLRPCAVKADLAWPAAYFAVILAWVQALAWSPFRLPGVRLIVGSVILSALLLGPILLRIAATEETTLTAFLLPLLPVAYLVALIGVYRARHGAGRGLPSEAEPVARTGVTDAIRPFSSPVWAQVWLEWRLNRWGVRILVGLWLIALVPLAHFQAVAIAQDELLEIVAPWLVAVVEKTGVGWLAVSAVLFGPLCVAAALGVDLGRMTPQARKITLPGFFTTLPLDTGQFLRGKLILPGLVMLFAWAVFSLAGFIWAAAAGHLGDMADRLVALTGSGTVAVALLGVAFLLLVLVTWLWTLRDTWAYLAGWPFMVWLPLSLALLPCVVPAFVVRWWVTMPESRPVIVGLVILALALKAAAVMGVLWRTRRDRLVSNGVLAGVVAGWLLLVVASGGLVCWLCDGGAALFAGLVLLIPLARPLAMPLALDHNRHR